MPNSMVGCYFNVSITFSNVLLNVFYSIATRFNCGSVKPLLKDFYRFMVATMLLHSTTKAIQMYQQYFGYMPPTQLSFVIIAELD